MIRNISTVVVAGILAGCVAGKEVVTTVPFDANEVSYINRGGSNTINGQAFLRQRGGGVVTCAGNSVYLTPAGEYARQRISQIYGNESGGYVSVYMTASDNGDPDYQRMSRETVCDAEGDYEFSNVANGDYYLTSCVTWQVQTYTAEGGCLSRLVSARGGTQRVMLTQ